jgi:hypothetical protein
MPLIVSDRKPFRTDMPEGTFDAICIGIFDIGTVQSQNPKYKPKETVLFLFEFPELRDPEGWPRTMSEAWTASLDPKAKLFKHLKIWKGSGFKQGETKSFDLRSFLGKPARMLLVHNAGTGDKADNLYCNIELIQPWPPNQPAPKPSRQPLFFDFADGKATIPEGTPEYIQKRIMESPEYRALKEGRAPKSAEKLDDNKAPREIAGYLEMMKLGWPYTKDELDEVFDPAEMGQDEYDLLERFATPF